MTLLNQILLDLDSTVFNQADTAREAIFTRGSAAPVTTNVVVFKNFQQTQGMENYQITALGKTAVFSAARAGDTLLINGITYKILGPAEHGGFGVTKLYLTED